MNGAETLKRAQENKLAVAQIRMQQCMCGVTKLDRIRNEIIGGGTESGEKSQRKFKRGGGPGAGIYDEKRRQLPRKKGDGNGSTIK